MKGNNGLKFVLVIVCIAILTWICLAGKFNNEPIPGNVSQIRLGIDIKGGVDARLYAQYPKTSKKTIVTQADLETAKVVIEKRLDYQQIYDRVVTVIQTWLFNS